MQEVLAKSKDCNTKEQWEQLFREGAAAISHAKDAGAIKELFLRLKKDPNSLHYPGWIWALLIEGSRASWDNKLGMRIYQFCRSIPDASVAIPAAEAFLESGNPRTARKAASRALRLKSISSVEQLQLQMILCKSYVEDGNYKMASKLLERMESALDGADIDSRSQAEFVNGIARTKFFLGHYDEAADRFFEAHRLYKSVSEWELAARALFNTAACFHNDGDPNYEKAFEYLAMCKHLSEAHELHGPLAHCHAFYGTDAYQHGHFHEAIEHYTKALGLLPGAETSFRRLHITSMLAFAYLRIGRLRLSKKFMEQTLELAERDRSERFKARYINLKCEVLWQEGLFEESYDILCESVQPLIRGGVHTLEDLSLLSSYFYQSAMLGNGEVSLNVAVRESLEKNTPGWLEYRYACGTLLLSKGRVKEARQLFTEDLERAQKFGSYYFVAIANWGLILCELISNTCLDKVEEKVREFEVVIGRFSEGPLKATCLVLYAALEYRRGSFQASVRYLKRALAQKSISSTERVALQAWLQTAEGHSPKVVDQINLQIIATLTRTYFRPRIKTRDGRIYHVSRHYKVSLDNHPVLRGLLAYLMTKADYGATPKNLQRDVWRESLAVQGWEQKIRNAQMRLRELFPFTLAPLLIMKDTKIHIFSDAIKVTPIKRAGASPEAEVLRLLREGPLSSGELSNRINVSQATTKRILRRLHDREVITLTKIGRNVYYKAH